MRKTAGLSAAALVITSLAAGVSGATASPGVTSKDGLGHTTRQADETGAIARSAIAAVKAHPPQPRSETASASR